MRTTHKDALRRYLDDLPGHVKAKVSRFVNAMTDIRPINSSDDKFPIHGRKLIKELHERYHVPFRALERPLGLRPMRGMNAYRAYRSPSARKALRRAS